MLTTRIWLKCKFCSLVVGNLVFIINQSNKSAEILSQVEKKWESLVKRRLILNHIYMRRT
ncbi:hypothetical protein CsSME_00051074 [Camellia sinensis var. sinensis]